MGAVQSQTTSIRLPKVLTLPRDKELPISTCPLIMGVLNITPDSFSDGGLWLNTEAAIEHGLNMLQSGADLLDLGAESTRPGGGAYGAGAATVDPQQELDRLLPVLEGLRQRTGAPLSIDTRKGIVAQAALASGADLINDISGLADPELGKVVAVADCPLVLMHSRGELRNMQQDIAFTNLLAEVHFELSATASRAVAAGVSREQLIIDPGIGFGKTAAQNLLLLRNLDCFHDFELPLLVGASRKSFIGEITAQAPEHRLAGSLAAVAWSAHHRAAIVRVHDVAETSQFLKTWQAIDRATRGKS